MTMTAPTLGDANTLKASARVRAVAAPVAELLERQVEDAAGGIGPAQPVFHLEGLDVGQAAILVARSRARQARRFNVRTLTSRRLPFIRALAPRGPDIRFKPDWNRAPGDKWPGFPR